MRLPLLAGALLVGALGACKPQGPIDPGAARSNATIQPPADPVVVQRTADAGAVHRVSISGMRFEPPQLQVKVGERIRWTNDDLVPHTVTGAQGRFDSGILAPNASWEWAPVQAGDFAYACTIHPAMTGSVNAN